MTDLTTAQIALLLKCTPRTVRNLVLRGHFPNAVKLDPSRKNSPLRIPKADVDKFIKKRRHAIKK